MNINTATDRSALAEPMRLPGGAPRVLASARRWALAHRERLNFIATVFALTLFGGGLVLALEKRPGLFSQIQLSTFFLMVAVPAPLGLVISALDLQHMAKLSKVRIPFWTAVKLTIYSRAGNILPIPGSFAVRLLALHSAGANPARSGGLLLLFTGIWGGMGFSFSAVWLDIAGQSVYSSIFAVTGIFILLACGTVAWRTKLDLNVVAVAACLRLSQIVLEPLTLMLAVQAIGEDCRYDQTAMLVVGYFLASLTQVGLGVREALLAALAPLAGIDPATGFLAGAAQRAAGLAFLLCSTLGLALRDRYKSTTRQSRL